MKSFGIGVIGSGFMGKAHSYAYRNLPIYYEDLPFKVRLVGVASRSLENANKLKEAAGFEFATDDARDLFKRDDIDVISICSPNHIHYENIMDAIDTGKHIYCDKPLATSHEEALKILERLKGKDIIHQIAFQNRFLPAILRAKELADEGFLGNILSFRANYLHSGSVDPDRPLGFKMSKSLGGGVIADLGSHVLDLIYHLLGEYKDIFATSRVLYEERYDETGNRVRDIGEDLAILIVNMKSGGTGTIEVSKIATGKNDELSFEIHGDKGTMAFDLMDPNWLYVYDNTLPDQDLGGDKGYKRIESVQRYKRPGGKFVSPKASIGWLRGHVHSIYNFLDNLYNERPSSPDLEDAAYIQYLMEMAHKSIKEGQWIALD